MVETAVDGVHKLARDFTINVRAKVRTDMTKLLKDVLHQKPFRHQNKDSLTKMELIFGDIRFDIAIAV